MSTNASPEFRLAATSSTWAARVLRALVPLTWNREVPSVSYESTSWRFLNPEAMPPCHW